MAYRLKHSESVPEGVKRIAREELGDVVKALRGQSGVSRDEAIHEARKTIKKVRALLRLVRRDLGDTYALENARLRDAGRKLSPLRDAGALIGAFDELRRRNGSDLEKGTAAAIRRSLTLRKKHLEQEADLGNVMKELATLLAPALRSAARWPLQTDGFAALEPGLARTFRDGRKALAVAQKNGSREQFHEWRKRVKDHWYHVRLLENLWSDVMKGYEQSLKELETALGEDLNLAILQDHILSAPNVAPRGPALDGVVKAIDASRKEMRESALAIGERVYGEKPSRITRQMSRLWEAWRDNPI